MTAEGVTQAHVRLALGKRPDVRVFRNTVGQAWIGDAQRRDGELVIVRPRRVTFGLFPGSSDLIGWRSVTVTPDLVGRVVAIFAAIEVKAGRGTATSEQQQFIEAVRQAGGIAGVARTVEEAEALLEAGDAPRLA